MNLHTYIKYNHFSSNNAKNPIIQFLAIKYIQFLPIFTTNYSTKFLKFYNIKYIYFLNQSLKIRNQIICN